MNIGRGNSIPTSSLAPPPRLIFRRPGIPVPIRILIMAPFIAVAFYVIIEAVLIPIFAGNVHGSSLVWLVLMIIFFIVGVAGLLFGYCWLPLQERHLMRLGAVIPARITKKSIERTRGSLISVGGTPMYFISYGCDLTQGKMWVRKPDYDAANVGDAVVVVYDPRKPHHNVIYGYSEYAVRDRFGEEVR